MSSLAIHPLIPLKARPGFRANTAGKPLTVSVRLGNSGNANNQQQRPQQQQLNLSVLRFTFGIPGLDESYLPRFIGYGFGSLLLLNRFVGSYSGITPAQLRTEALGLSLAAFSIALPYFGRFLKGTATTVGKATLPQGIEQIFVMSQNISDASKEDLAWATYVLLSNTNTIAVILETGRCSPMGPVRYC
uniref:Uncharacterized protein LOC105648509 isoform X2 n=1 Tax=Rhizophora mucronata TaxID=61149 RepID=A0A2P2JIN5_RHIMU